MLDKDKPMVPASSEPATHTVPAAWPTGMAHLGLAVTTEERRDPAEVGDDSRAQTPCRIETVPPFCPSAQDLQLAKVKGRG
jgi:hypothetical protein